MSSTRMLVEVMATRHLVVLLVLVFGGRVSGNPRMVANDGGVFANVISEIVGDVGRSKRLSTLTVIQDSQGSETGRDLIVKVLRLNGENLIVQSETELIHATRFGKWRFSLIVLDDIEAFRRICNRISSALFSFRGFFLVVLTNQKLIQIEEIFGEFWRKYIFNVAVIFEESDSVRAATFMPFGGISCGDTTARFADFDLGTFTNLSSELLFPKKFTNLHGCPVTIATYEDNIAVKRTPNALSGFDMDLVDIFSKMLNFKREFIWKNGSTPYGIIYPNGSVDGALGDIVHKRAQVATSRMWLLQDRMMIADISSVYFNFPQVFVISPGKRLTQLEKLLQPFETIVWVLTLFVLLIGVAVIWIIRLKLTSWASFVFGKNVNDPIFNMLVVVFGGSQQKLPARNFARYLLAMFLILFLVLRSAYQGSVFMFLQSDKHLRSVESIDDMIDQEFRIYMTKSHLKNFFDNQSEIVQRFVIFQAFCSSDFNRLNSFQGCFHRMAATRRDAEHIARPTATRVVRFKFACSCRC
jgi:hypothetical protein